MKRAWLVACAALFAAPAAAQQYSYVARTEAPVTRQGAVTAGILTWQCQGSACSIAGPWPIPSPEACAQLAREVGRIVAYGYAGRMLDAAGLATCNAGLPAAPPPGPAQIFRPGGVRVTGTVERPAPGVIRTPELSFVGGGDAPVVAPVSAAIAVPELSFVGGDSTIVSFVSVPVDVPELSFVAE